MNFLFLLETTPAVFYALVALLGLFVGSFLNVVIHRLPTILKQQWCIDCSTYLYPDDEPPKFEKYTLSHPRSHCPNCNATIRWYSNIPLVSWLLQKGKCRDCNQPISARYPLIEFLTMALSLAVAFKFGFSIQALFALIFVYVSIALFFIDAEHKLLPDRLVFPLIGLGLIINVKSVFVSPDMAILGVVIGFTSLWSIYIIMKLITGKEGMGYGDFKYLAAIGAWFGPLVIAPIFVYSAALGLFYVLGGFIARKIHGSENCRNPQIAFGPFLVISAFIIMLFVN